MEEYLYDYTTSNKWKERIMVMHSNALEMRDELGFDKVIIYKIFSSKDTIIIHFFTYFLGFSRCSLYNRSTFCSQ